jgi:small subunit ribosomal protein S2
MSVTMRQMLEAGVHFGHQTRFWNPKMAPYIFGHRNKIHIINLEKTLESVPGCDEVRAPARQQSRHHPVRRHQAPGARDHRRGGAARGMPYVDQRWLGGMLTNFKTVKTSIKRLKEMEAGDRRRRPGAHVQEGGAADFQRELDKLNKAIGGIKDMNGAARRAVRDRRRLPQDRGPEAAKLGIPVVAVVDTNHSPGTSTT